MTPKVTLIDDASVHFAASKNKAYRLRVVERFATFVGFLQRNQLTLRTLLKEGEQPTETLRITRDDLTELGYTVVVAAYHQWLKGIDKGKPISDVSVLEDALEKAKGATH